MRRSDQNDIERLAAFIVRIPSEGTVKVHITAKLGIRGRTEAVARARGIGLLLN